MNTKSEPYPVWKTVPFTIADAKALQALAQGTANEDQQKRALIWITNGAGMLNFNTFQPGSSARESDFAQGRRFVGVQIRRMISTNLEVLRKDDACKREEHIIEKEQENG